MSVRALRDRRAGAVSDQTSACESSRILIATPVFFLERPERGSPLPSREAHPPQVEQMHRAVWVLAQTQEGVSLGAPKARAWRTACQPSRWLFPSSHGAIRGSSKSGL